ncbi:hypothetical protein H0H93_004653 [Arthromyces matolae]|nr:hypothetical protein H0H93_004653 [Arthromyces matolae]
MPHSRSHLEQGIEEAYEDINDDFHNGDRDDDYEESYTNRTLTPHHKHKLSKPSTTQAAGQIPLLQNGPKEPMQTLDLRIFAVLVVLSAAVAQGVPLDLGPRSGEPLPSFPVYNTGYSLGALSQNQRNRTTWQRDPVRVRVLEPNKCNIQSIPAATVLVAHSIRSGISINELLSPAPVPFDPNSPYPRQSIFSMDEIPGDLQKLVDECKDYREILKIAQVIAGKDNSDVTAMAKLRKMHPDDLLLIAMKIRRKALLRRAEEMKRNNQKLANLPSNLCQHYRQMITLAKRHGSKYVEDHTKQIIDNLERALNPKPRDLRWLDTYFSQCS